MTIMNTELYEALIAAGAPDDKAKSAANVVEEQNKRFDGMDRRFDKVEASIESLRNEMDTRFDAQNKEMDTRFDMLEKDMENRFNLVDHKFDAISKDLKITIGGYFVVAVGVILGVMKLM